MGAGAEVGVEAEVGTNLGPTTRVDLPGISLEGPNPVWAAADWGIGSAKNLSNDPIGTVKPSAEYVAGAAQDFFDAEKGILG